MKYIVKFGVENTGLVPVFTIYVRMDTLVGVTAPAVITEIPNSGCYFFDETPNASYDVFFQIDGGAALDPAVRFQTGVVSVGDAFLDAPVSSVLTEAQAVNTKLGATVNGTVTADIADARSAVSTNISITTEARDKTLTTDAMVTDLTIAVGTPAGASLAADIAAVGVDVTEVGSDVGASGDAPGAATVFGQIYASRNTLQGDISSSMGTIAESVVRLLGLNKENSTLDQTIFDAKNNLTSGRFRIFASKAEAEAGTSPTAIYTITATYVAGTNNIETYSMVRDA